MKVIIAGSRSIDNYSLLLEAIQESKFDITTVISGAATGVDYLGEKYAQEHSLPVKQYMPKWKELSEHAEEMRNCDMAADADACLVIWDGSSLGTKSLIIQAAKRNIPIFVKTI